MHFRILVVSQNVRKLYRAIHKKNLFEIAARRKRGFLKLEIKSKIGENKNLHIIFFANEILSAGGLGGGGLMGREATLQTNNNFILDQADSIIFFKWRGRKLT